MLYTMKIPAIPNQVNSAQGTEGRELEKIYDKVRKTILAHGKAQNGPHRAVTKHDKTEP